MGDLCMDVQRHGPAAVIAGEHFGAGVSVLASRQAVSCAMVLLSWVELTAQQSCVVFFFFPCMHWLEGDCGVQQTYSKQLGHCGAAQPQLVTTMSLTAESFPSASLGSRTCSGCGCVGCGGGGVQHLVL